MATHLPTPPLLGLRSFKRSWDKLIDPKKGFVGFAEPSIAAIALANAYDAAIKSGGTYPAFVPPSRVANGDSYVLGNLPLLIRKLQQALDNRNHRRRTGGFERRIGNAFRSYWNSAPTLLVNPANGAYYDPIAVPVTNIITTRPTLFKIKLPRRPSYALQQNYFIVALCNALHTMHKTIAGQWVGQSGPRPSVVIWKGYYAD